MRNSKENNKIKNFKIDEEDRKEKLFLFCEKLIRNKNNNIDSKELETYASEIILIYNNIFNDDNLRRKATHIIRELAKRYDIILDLVMENARQYANAQYIDDAFPYSPNSFDVLAEIGKGNKRVISFLKDTVLNNYGIPRWNAIEALCQLDDPLADRIIIEIIQGKYPPKQLYFENDLSHIENIKGKSFIQRFTDKKYV